ncbi:uncharacterized protein LOC144654196, partial [Oculina patagonica]
NFTCFYLTGTKSGETSNKYLSTAETRFSHSDCSSVSRISISAAPALTGIEENGVVSKDTHSAGRDEKKVERPLCRTPEIIICLPANSVRSLSESDVSSTVTSLHAQEATYGTSQSRASFEDVPTTAQCTACSAQVLTHIEYRVSSMTWALAGLLCAFGCHLGCCLAPFFLKSVKDVVHLCPLCMTQLGKYAKG